jgi:hypothetical protein
MAASFPQLMIASDVARQLFGRAIARAIIDYLDPHLRRTWMLL